jgi:aspartyl-tRNA(Asn)/glutamyl-tRNA(Gln) amidotransferase subunit A
MLLRLTAGYDPLDPASANLPVPDYSAALTGDVKGLVIGVPWKWMDEDEPISPASRKALEDALEVFKGLGATVRAVELPPLVSFNDSKRIIAMSELFSIHEAVLRTRPDLLGASLRHRIMCGALLRAEDYVQAMRMRVRLASAMQNAFRDIDVMVLPCMEPAPVLKEGNPESLFTSAGYTAPFNSAGNPALSVCNGFTDDGLPFSLQIAGRLFDEATVLRVGDAYEKATPWRQRRPDIADLARQSQGK